MNGSTKRKRNIERLAAALQDCFDAAVEEGVNRAAERLKPRLDKMDRRLDKMDQSIDKMGQRLDRQDDTLRLMWKQMKGEGKLPIDQRT